MGTNEDSFFSSLNLKTKTEEGESFSFAIWSINKNANSGKSFLRFDNKGKPLWHQEDTEMKCHVRI